MNAYQPIPSPSGSAGKIHKPSTPRTIIVASLIGTSLERYDFFLYVAATALIFNKLLFPTFDPLVCTMLGFTIAAVGFIARPLGGIVFGHFGDRVDCKQVLAITHPHSGPTRSSTAEQRPAARPTWSPRWTARATSIRTTPRANPTVRQP